MTDAPFVAILADDLIWATRLDRLIRDAGGRTALVRSLDGLDGALDGSAGRPDGVVIDLTSRAYDGIDAIRHAAASGAAVVAVGQHDDRAGREAARAAGAADVFAYGRLFVTGPRVMSDWLRRIEDRRS